MATMKLTTSRPLRRRVAPTQARSKETFERVLVVAAELLDEVGWEGFNTNLLAKRAEIGIRGLYRYFPNKQAVAVTLAKRMVERWDRWFRDFGVEIQASQGDWASVWTTQIDGFVRGLAATPGALGIRRAMLASPELRRIDQDDNARLAEALATLMRESLPEMKKTAALAASRMLIETAVAGIDTALDSPPRTRARIMEALKAMQGAYLAELFGTMERNQ